MKRITYLICLSLLFTLSLNAQDKSRQNPPPKPDAHAQKMSKQDSLKQAQKNDSLRKAYEAQIEEMKRKQANRPKLSKEDSIKRINRIDSIRRVRIAEGQTLPHQKPLLTKQDSMKREAKLDSLRKVYLEKQAKEQQKTK